MRRPVLVFAGAVLLPGLILGGLALRSLRSQEALHEGERIRLLQGAVERLAQATSTRLDEHQRDFSLRVESLLGRETPRDLARAFDDRIRGHWPLAGLGFAVALSGDLLSPALLGRPEARQFLVRNDEFLCNRSSVEVFAVTPKGRINLADLDPPAVVDTATDPGGSLVPRRFAQLVGDAQEGVLARFLDDQLVVWVWYRTPRDPDLVFGTQLELPRLRTNLAGILLATPPPAPGVALALLDERGRPVAASPGDSAADWTRPIASAPVGPHLPNWRAAAAVHDPTGANRELARLQRTLGLVVVLLVAALATGGWLVLTDARRQLDLARRKSDFVGNVSHELRTPLTSIRLFAEMLAEDRVTEPSKRRQQLGIIQAEAARLQRLIGNILDFARHERGDGRLRLEGVDLAAVAREVLDSFGPQFEAEGFRAGFVAPPEPVPVAGDPDALAQLIHNLLSNALKYAAPGGELTLRVSREGPVAALEVLDRGPGVPAPYRERVFEQFFRADDALSSGIPGAGLGLTLARQIARAHRGDLVCLPRDGGGAVFRFHLPARTDTP